MQRPSLSSCGSPISIWTDRGFFFANINVPEYPFLVWHRFQYWWYLGVCNVGFVFISWQQKKSASDVSRKSSNPFFLQALRPFTFHDMILTAFTFSKTSKCVGRTMMSGLSYYNRGILPPAIENTHSAFLLHDRSNVFFHKTKWMKRIFHYLQ